MARNIAENGVRSMKRRQIVALVGVLAVLTGVGGSMYHMSGKEEICRVDADKRILINPEKASTFHNGEFEGWGTSFCWWANRLGYSDILSEQVADLFYSKEQGLGLNIARYNIGGGDDPTHSHITRTDSAVPGYWKDGTEKYENGTYSWEYDWSKDANQRNVLLKCAEAYGEDIIVEAFSNSPPYFMTNSGCSSGAEKASENNLREDAYPAFAKYLAEVSAQFRDEWKIEFQSISAMNEPYTSYWSAGSWKQEGCHFDQGEPQSEMIVELKAAMEEQGFTDVIYSGTDETDIDVQITSYEKLSEEAKDIISRIDTHSYEGMKYEELKAISEEAGKNLWMSEVDGGEVEGSDAEEMGSALYFAHKIIRDMNGLTPSAWIMWQVIDNHICEAGYNGNQDYGMPDTTGGFWGIAVADHDKEEIILTKKYFAFGQFTRYIKPGYTIIGGGDTSLAALDKENNQLVIVVINTEAEDIVCDFDLSMFSEVGTTVQAVRTSGDMKDGENWEELELLTTYGKGFTATLKANSITTYIVEGVVDGGEEWEEIALSEEMISSSEAIKGNGCCYVLDGDINTYFEGKEDGFIEIDLGKIYRLDAISYVPRSALEKRCIGGTFEGSVNGKEWFPLFTITDMPDSDWNYVTQRACTSDAICRYVRYSMPEKNNSLYLAELKIYGKKATFAEAMS